MADGCDECPATYGSALYWLVSRLMDGDPEGIGAVTASVRVIVLVATAVGMVLVAGVLVSGFTTAISRRLAPADSADPKDGLVALNAEPEPALPTAVAERNTLPQPATISAVVSTSAILIGGIAIGAYVNFRRRARS